MMFPVEILIEICMYLSADDFVNFNQYIYHKLGLTAITNKSIQLHFITNFAFIDFNKNLINRQKVFDIFCSFLLRNIRFTNEIYFKKLIQGDVNISYNQMMRTCNDVHDNLLFLILTRNSGKLKNNKILHAVITHAIKNGYINIITELAKNDKIKFVVKNKNTYFIKSIYSCAIEIDTLIKYASKSKMWDNTPMVNRYIKILRSLTVDYNTSNTLEFDNEIDKKKYITSCDTLFKKSRIIYILLKRPEVIIMNMKLVIAYFGISFVFMIFILFIFMLCGVIVYNR